MLDDRVRALARDAGHILWTARPDGTSKSLTTWQLYCGEETAPGLAGWLDAIHPEDRGRAERSWREALAERGVFELCARVRRSDGLYRVFLLRGVPVFDQSGAVMEWACFGTDVDERQQTKQEIHDRQALRDALTGLPNKLLFEDRLQQAILIARRDRDTLAVIVIELQSFQTKDMDLAVHDIAKRLREALDDSDTLARLGHHAFAMVLLGADEHGATRLVRKLFLALEHRIEKSPGHESLFAAGIALFPRHGTDAETLLRRAQAAVDTSKQTGGGYALYGSVQQQAARRPLLSDELRAAIEGDEIVLHYQPKVDLRTGLVTSVEALVSWKHPLYGAMPRDEVIEVAELSGLIEPLTRSVVGAALRQCAVWQAEGIDIGVSINLSIRNLHDPDLADEISDSLRLHGVRPPKLTIEIDEGSIAAVPDVARRVIDRFHAFGVNVSVDHFGTGYSALSLLARLPVREVKIDRALVSRMEIDEHDALAVRTLIDAGHGLGLRVVAAGVETRHTLQQIANLNCDYAQGYMISEPLEADDVPRWIATSYVVPT